MKKRNIKFRAWDWDAKKMIYDGITVINDVVFMTVETEDCWYELHLTSTEWYPMQVTPLKDGLNREIWEGDIAEIIMTNEFGSMEKKLGVMEMTEGGYWAFVSDSQYDVSCSIPPTVVGNIYQNPELIKK